MTEPRTDRAPMPFVWHPRTRRHVPNAQIRLGMRLDALEAPERVTVIREALIRAGHPEVTAADPALKALQAVHDPRMIEHLRTIHDAWVIGGYPAQAGQDRVVPTIFPIAGMLDGLPLRRPAAAHARAGQYCFDTQTLIGPGTWDAVEAAAGAALSAVDLVTRGRWASTGEPVPADTPLMAYALCRPPGHHAAAAAFGAGCYLNNAAIAAQALRDRGAWRVAVVDVDAHHGNGTQAIFYDRADVFVGSAHIDPGAGWFPHFMGFADETGRGAGMGATLNVPVPARSTDQRWLPAVETVVSAVRDYRPEALVVSLGVDAAAEDPSSPLRLTEDGLRTTGLLIGTLRLPTVVVQEGGYHLPTLGPLVTAALAGLVEGSAEAR